MSSESKPLYEEKCVLCGEDIDYSKKYVVEEITEWNNDVGKSTEKNYHPICFGRSRR